MTVISIKERGKILIIKDVGKGTVSSQGVQQCDPPVHVYFRQKKRGELLLDMGEGKCGSISLKRGDRRE